MRRWSRGRSTIGSMIFLELLVACLLLLPLLLYCAIPVFLRYMVRG
jgi:hypothetical protein